MSPVVEASAALQAHSQAGLFLWLDLCQGWYAKYRLPDGRQVQKKSSGPAWTGRGRPPGRCFTKAAGGRW
jgi:hypothetical protein